MIILGITHPISWNNAACILVDGELIAMVEEERLNRIKHAPRMAARLAMEYCLQQANVKLSDVDYVAVGFDRAVKAALPNLAKVNLLQGLNQAAYWYREGTYYEKQLPLQGYDPDRVLFVNHHYAHAASAFFPSGFAKANIISLDGSGGSESGILAIGEGKKIEILKTISNSGSWGLAYELITEKLGFRRHSGEGKVMGLAAYGKPDPAGLPFVDWEGEIPTIDGEKRKAFVASLKTRQKDDPITEEHKNLAATLQDTLERAVMQMAGWLSKRSGVKDFVLGGGVALNCSMNGKLAHSSIVDHIFVQPAAHDGGTALGAALQVYVEKTGKLPGWKMTHAFWGPEYSNDEIESALRAFQDINYRRSDDIFTETAQYLKEGKIVGWFQGRSEIGPRALGNRSILADPSIAEMKDKVNNQVKHREPWRPFAPSILEEDMDRYFDHPIESPYMILAFDTKRERWDELAAAIHVDRTARPQSVSRQTNPRYWQLIQRFKEIRGIPAVLNTSFNVDSQPIVNAPQEAIDTFLNCGIDILAIGDFIAWKDES